MIETDKTTSAAATDNQRGPRDLREWMDAIEADGSLLRVSAPVNVQEELAAATYMVAQEENSPALLFETSKTITAAYASSVLCWVPVSAATL